MSLSKYQRPKKEISILDLFSGIGGFSKGFIDAGYRIKNHWFSEIDKHAIANYTYNFKHSEYVGTVETIRGSGIKPNVITFGSPCQGFSLAGKGDGLGDERSNLILEAIRIIRQFRPNIFIWENVKGAFSTNAGADFWAVIKAFADIGDYRLEWQLVNTSWFLPQNRERIYLVGHLAGGSKPGIFPFRENDFRFNERTKQTPNIRTLTAGGNSGGMHSSMTLVKQINHLHDFGGSSTKQQNRIYDDSGISPTLNQDSRKNISITNLQGNHYSNTIRSGGVDGGRKHNWNYVTDQVKIRRLTEIECERLQGFPDDWTKYGDYNGTIKEIARTNRYKMLGNAVTVNVVKAIAERIELL